MYQQNFPHVTPPQPTPPMSSLTPQVIADPPRRWMLGIFGRALGRFILGKVPSSLPAPLATCPYVPYHVMAAGQDYNAQVVDVNSVLTALQREATVVPTYPQNVAALTSSQEISEPVPPLDSLDARPARLDFIAGKDDSIAETPPVVIDTAPISDQPQNLDGR